MVKLGHCTRNDCALAETAAMATTSNVIQIWSGFLMVVQPPRLNPQTEPAVDPLQWQLSLKTNLLSIN